MNKTTLPLSEENYKKIIQTIREGYEYNGVKVKPNERVALILMTIAITGLRVSDVLLLTLNSVAHKDANTLIFKIKEKKTKKKRDFIFNNDLYMVLMDYAISNNISKDSLLFSIKSRQVNRMLEQCVNYLGLSDYMIGTHSFRKTFSMRVYEASSHNLAVVQTLLQHSSPNITRRYLAVSNEEINAALASTGSFLI